MKKRINPRRRHATYADVAREKEAAKKEAISIAMTIFFTVLLDKEHADKEILQRVWAEVNDLSESISNGYVTYADLRHTLLEECEIAV